VRWKGKTLAHDLLERFVERRYRRTLIKQNGVSNMTKGLDINALYIALDATRASRGQSWYAVSKELGIPRSTFTRAKKGKKPDADALTKLLVWSGADIARLQA
jgi:hypothetical protein